MIQLYLASQSPRRRKILRFAGIPFKVKKPLKVVEKRKKGETPKDLVIRLAHDKAKEVSIHFPRAWIIGADTVVVCGNRIFGKPKNPSEANRMLLHLQNRWHIVWTGVVLIGDEGRWQKKYAEKTKVFFRKLKKREMRNYLNSKEPYDKAGAYDIQGTARHWIAKWEGDYFNVMGLPLQWVLCELNGVVNSRKG